MWNWRTARGPGAGNLHLLLTIGLALTAGYFWGRGSGPTLAFAQNNTTAGARGVYAFSGPIEANRYGLFMLDIEQGTVWCYEFDRDDTGTRKLRLSAARSWIYDRYLKNFNCAGMTPTQIQELVNQERANLAAGASGSVGAAGSSGPTATKDPKPTSDGDNKP